MGDNLITAERETALFSDEFTFAKHQVLKTLSLLMVPTCSPCPGVPNLGGDPEMSEEDFSPSTTHSYLIPRWDLDPDSGAFLRLQFPGIGTAFLERAAPPKRQAAYHTANHAPGEGYIPSFRRVTGKIVLVDEEDGSVVGELTDGYDIVEKPGVEPGSNFQRKAKVIRSVSATFLRNISGCPGTPSTIVQTSASRLIVTGSSCLNNVFASGAYSFTKESKPNPKPVAFSADTHIRIRKISSISHGAAELSVKTVSQVSKYAQNFGASSAGGNEMDQLSSHDGFGNRVEDKPAS
ncbi:hypothetical protein V1508DRAFT_396315 [Lipomyces doorenjongii]|uniref:uncharacterized protein n=1 Tax=Lipomyces doorenjongii TaxID=383834 RepID=UPI0034CFEBEE